MIGLVATAVSSEAFWRVFAGVIATILTVTGRIAINQIKRIGRDVSSIAGIREDVQLLTLEQSRLNSKLGDIETQVQTSNDIATGLHSIAGLLDARLNPQFTPAPRREDDPPDRIFYDRRQPR